MKRLLCTLCALLLLTGCTPSGQDPSQMNIVATTYPAYLAALAVTEGVEGVSVSRLDTGSVSCLHDYTLTVNDMKKLSRADVIVINGAGLEDFMSDALAATDALVINCSEGIDMLPATGHHEHEHDHEHSHETDHFDPHCWLSTYNMTTFLDTVLSHLLSLIDPQQSARMVSNTERATSLIKDCELECRQAIQQSDSSIALITFHDGFQYFAHTFGLPLLHSIEEEAGSEASAKEILEISQLVKERDIRAIFTEVNGSDATANAIARETGCAVAQLSMIMDGREPSPQDSSPIAPYIEAMNSNVTTVITAFSQQEVD